MIRSCESNVLYIKYYWISYNKTKIFKFKKDLLNLNDIAPKVKLYHLLVVEGGLYLSPKEEKTLKFVCDICIMKKG